MKISEIKEVVRRGLGAKTKRAIYLWGPPGVGKSQAIKQVCEEEDAGYVDFRLAQCDPSDLRGVLVFNPKTSKAEWAIPSIFPNGDAKKKGVIILDELNLAVPSVQAAAYQLVLDRQIGTYKVPDGWLMIAAGNRAEDKANVFKLPAPLANRFHHVTIEEDFEEWRAWAFDHDIMSTVIAFLTINNDMLSKPPDKNAVKREAFPTGRTWEFSSDLLKMGLNIESRDEMLKGTVGEGAAHMFIGFLGLDQESQEILGRVQAGEMVLANEVSLQFLINTYVATGIKKKTINSVSAVKYCLAQKEIPEPAVMLLRDIVRFDRSVIKSKEWAEVTDAYQEISW